jgi:prophage regulatory protein
MSASELRRERERKRAKRDHHVDRPQYHGRRILRLPQVKVKTGKSRTGIYESIERGDFPKPVPLGPRAVGWLEAEIDQWLDRCISARDARLGGG